MKQKVRNNLSLRYPRFKEIHARFTMVLFKSLSVSKSYEDIHVFQDKTDYSHFAGHPLK